MAENFFEKTITALQQLSVLEVNTVVGDFSFADQPTNLKVDLNTTTTDKMVSRVNLLSGDITTAMSPKFVDEYKDLREYHMIRENQGHEIIKRNIAVVEKIAETLVDLIEKKDSVGDKLDTINKD